MLEASASSSARRSRHAVWEHFEEIERRANAKAHPKAKCNYCGKRISGRPKTSMIPHLVNCAGASLSVRQQWQRPQEHSRLSMVTTSSSLMTEETSDIESESSQEDLELVPHTSETRVLHSETQLQRLELLKLKAKVARYQARAMEAELMAETLAARIKLQNLGLSESEIEVCMSSLP